MFPQQNFGWLHIPNLPAGEYTLYVQFKDQAAGVHGFENIYMSTYGLNECPALKDGTCSKISEETALDDLQTGGASAKPPG